MFGSWYGQGKSKEPITWKVLSKENNRLLVISKHALDRKQYHTSYSPVTWETCSLRKWLNGSFLKTAFNTDEQKMIPTVTVSAEKNPDYNTSPGNSTQDQIFLLSIPEVNKYFTSDMERQCKSTAYAKAQGCVDYGNGNCSWWLRSPGDCGIRAAFVNGEDGDVSGNGYGVRKEFGVRPAFWINLDSDLF